MNTIWLRCADCEDWPRQRVRREFKLKDTKIEKTSEKQHTITYRIDIILEGSCGHKKRMMLLYEEEE
jgi:hypothetical protein